MINYIIAEVVVDIIIRRKPTLEGSIKIINQDIKAAKFNQ